MPHQSWVYQNELRERLPEIVLPLSWLGSSLSRINDHQSTMWCRRIGPCTIHAFESPQTPMPLLSYKSIMAVSTVVDVALYSRERPVLAFDLAKRLHVRARHLEPVIQALAREGILVGVRGRNGGYKLAKERRAISAYDILQTVKTIEAVMSTQSYSGLAGAVVLPALAQAEQIFASSLKRITVEDLVQARTAIDATCA